MAWCQEQLSVHFKTRYHTFYWKRSIFFRAQRVNSKGRHWDKNNGRCIAKTIGKWAFFNDICIAIKIALKHEPNSSFEKRSALVQATVWRQVVYKPSVEAILTLLTMGYPPPGVDKLNIFYKIFMQPPQLPCDGYANCTYFIFQQRDCLFLLSIHS